MRITFLGTGNAFAPGRDWSCILVEEAILLDAGPTVLANLKHLGADPARIRHIFISHFHGDHFLGLPFLLLEYHFKTRTTAPLTIIGPAGIAALVTRAMELAFPDIAVRGWPRPLHFVEVTPGTPQEADGLSFEAVPMEHSRDTLDAYGYRLHLPDGILAYSGDTGMTPALETLLDGARAVILEATEQDASPLHLSPAAIRALRDRLPAACTVLLTHLDRVDASTWAGFDVRVPNDLETITLEAVPGMARGAV
jgi:ribonuclease BN (tRNA processing enzyme)